MDTKNEYQRVYAEVNLDAVRSNMEHMKANIAEHTKMIGVIKTDGYGHGAVPIARELENMDYVFGYATATAEEALILRHNGIKKPILILGYTFPYSYEKLIREQVRMAVFREDTLEELSKAATRAASSRAGASAPARGWKGDLYEEEALASSRAGASAPARGWKGDLYEEEALASSRAGASAPARVHIKVDTGMSRIGIRPDASGLAFVKKAFAAEGIEVEGIFTHFARADEGDKTAAYAQLETFKKFLAMIKEETGREIPIKHCSNSAGIVELPEANMDVVRAGITLYGLWPSPEVKRDIVKLTPALSLYSHVVYVKEIEEGTPVSYGGTYRADGTKRIATIPVGYGDGYPRSLSGKGYVLLHGKKAPILGRVCMDQFMVDVTNIPEAAENDCVTLIGRDGQEQITMETLGELSGRFNYELACDLGKRIPRVYTKGGKVLCTRDYYQDF